MKGIKWTVTIGNKEGGHVTRKHSDYIAANRLNQIKQQLQYIRQGKKKTFIYILILRNPFSAQSASLPEVCLIEMSHTSKKLKSGLQKERLIHQWRNYQGHKHHTYDSTPGIPPPQRGRGP